MQSPCYCSSKQNALFSKLSIEKVLLWLLQKLNFHSLLGHFDLSARAVLADLQPKVIFFFSVSGEKPQAVSGGLKVWPRLSNCSIKTSGRRCCQRSSISLAEDLPFCILFCCWLLGVEQCRHSSARGFHTAREQTQHVPAPLPRVWHSLELLKSWMPLSEAEGDALGLVSVSFLLVGQVEIHQCSLLGSSFPLCSFLLHPRAKAHCEPGFRLVLVTAGLGWVQGWSSCFCLSWQRGGKEEALKSRRALQGSRDHCCERGAASSTAHTGNVGKPRGRDCATKRAPSQGSASN